MPKGRYQVEYFNDAAFAESKSVDDAYADVDAFSMEYFEDEPDFHERIDFVVPLPPLAYEGQFIKGIYFSQSVDFLNRLYPLLGQIFHGVANSQWGAIPWSQSADGLFSVYDNPDRRRWFDKTYPE